MVPCPPWHSVPLVPETNDPTPAMCNMMGPRDLPWASHRPNLCPGGLHCPLPSLPPEAVHPQEAQTKLRHGSPWSRGSTMLWLPWACGSLTPWSWLFPPLFYFRQLSVWLTCSPLSSRPPPPISRLGKGWDSAHAPRVPYARAAPAPRCTCQGGSGLRKEGTGGWILAPALPNSLSDLERP